MIPPTVPYYADFNIDFAGFGKKGRKNIAVYQQDWQHVHICEEDFHLTFNLLKYKKYSTLK